jgi:hypothetical protein
MHRPARGRIRERVCAAILAASAIAANAAATADNEHSAPEDYPVPRHGELRLQVPAQWQVKYIYSEDASRPPTFRVFPLEDEAFDMSVTVFWHDGLDQDITSAEALRARVEQAGAEALQGSTDRAVAVKPLTGGSGPGFLYDLHDASASPEDYHYLTQGALAVGQLVLVFTILTDERPSVHRDACLDFLRAIRHIYAAHGVSSLSRSPASRTSL